MWFEPIINLAIWGTIRPTKDITPPTPVDVLAKNTAIADIIIVCFVVSTPKLLEVLSSKDSKLQVLHGYLIHQ